jgi:hypothetical protein
MLHLQIGFVSVVSVIERAAGKKLHDSRVTDLYAIGGLSIEEPLFRLPSDREATT